jgi:hypothetical protein
VARFDGGTISSDGGAVLLAEAEAQTHVVQRFARSFQDHRDSSRVEHSITELVMQRVLGLCLGYEDLTDHDSLRADPLLTTLAGKSAPGATLAGKSTLSRLELSRTDSAAAHRYKRVSLDTKKVDQLLVDVFLESHARAPKEIVIDLDATDFPVHGRQEGRFFHGYYDHYCYLPLYIFCGEHLLGARLRRSNIDGSAGTLDELAPIVERIRSRWPSTEIVIRADSGFCREAIMLWCEVNDVEYVIGLAQNSRLVEMSEPFLGLAQCAYAVDLLEKKGDSAHASGRHYGELEYQTNDTWSRSRRVIARAEHSSKGDNPRFIVTSRSLDAHDGRKLYEDVYCARGNMENCIKEQQLDLFADRVSAQTLCANQVRLYFASIAYTLMHALRRIGLAGTDLERAQCGTIRLKLLKIGTQVRVSVRRVVLALSQAFPLQQLFAQALANMRAPPIPVA